MHPVLKSAGVALVTGGANGIGYAIAERLAGLGLKVVLFDRELTDLERSIERIRKNEPKAQCSFVHGDVTSEAALCRLEEHCEQLGPVRILVNNAAVASVAGPWNKEEVWHRVMQTNFWSVLRMQQVFVEKMIAFPGPSVIVNVGSKEGTTSLPGNSAYSVSKAALRVLTEQLAYELRERCAHVSAHLLVPGCTFTRMTFPDLTPTTPKPKSHWRVDQVAETLVDRLSKGDFYIYCEDNEVTSDVDQFCIQWSADDIIRNRPALSRCHPEYRNEFARHLSSRPNERT